ncbi:MAG TPA: FGGY-family carbohydrate kinase [Bacillales bacterium]|nr:FGGY-family carbohydrate kinase [Bacillales bacterium]
MVLDIGTTGGRALIFDSSGKMLSSAYCEYKSTITSKGFIEHDPMTWLEAIREGIHELKEKNKVLLSKVSALSVTSQRATLLPVDRDGKPLLPAILWQDKRSMAECAEIEKAVGSDEVYQRTGLKIDPYFSLPKLLWIRNHQPDIYQRAFCFLTTQDYIIHSLTGEFKTDWTQASRTMLFNVNDLRWDHKIAEIARVELDKLPEFYPPGTIAGKVTKACSEQIGLLEGLPVIMAGGDQQCAALGLGVIHPGITKVTTGTGSFVIAPVDFPEKDTAKKILCSPSAIPGSWVVEAGIFTTGATYRWLRDEFFEGEEGGSFEVMNKEAQISPTGANGVLHIPHYAGSAAPYWDAEATGCLFNLNLGTKKSDIVRAYLEGIAFEVKKNVEIIHFLIQNSGKQGLSEVRVSGGLARSDLFNQIQADIYELKVIPGRTEQATALGAAISGFTAMKTFNSFEEAVEKMVTLDQLKVKHPNQVVRKVYRQMGKLHDKVYSVLSKENIYSMAKQIQDSR